MPTSSFALGFILPSCCGSCVQQLSNKSCAGMHACTQTSFLLPLAPAADSETLQFPSSTLLFSSSSQALISPGSHQSRAVGLQKNNTERQTPSCCSPRRIPNIPGLRSPYLQTTNAYSSATVLQQLFLHISPTSGLLKISCSFFTIGKQRCFA